MHNYAIPEKKLNQRTQVSYALEHTTNKAFRQSWNTWVSVDEDHDIVKPYRRFTGGKVLAKDIPVLRDFFNKTANEIIRQKRDVIEQVQNTLQYDFDPKKIIANPKSFVKMLQEAIDQCEEDRAIINEILPS